MKKRWSFLLALFLLLSCFTPFAKAAQKTGQDALSISFSSLQAGSPGEITVRDSNGNGISCDVYLEGVLLGATNSSGHLVSSDLTKYSGPYIVTAKYQSFSVEATALVKPGKYPLDLSITPSNDPSTSVNVSFITSQSVSKFTPSVTQSSTGEAEKASFSDITNTDQDVLYKTNDTDSQTVPVRFHSFTITGLQPDTKYDLYINETKQGSFKTSPKESSASVSFAVFGDTQQSNYKLYQGHYGLVAQELKKGSYDFLINTGDLVNAGWSGREWDWWYVNGQDLVSNALFAPTMGNHEAADVTARPGDMYYRLRFKTPANAPASLGTGTYSFSYGSVHIAVLDTQGTDANLIANWLKEDMPTAQNRWRIVVLHDSLFSIVRDQSALRKILAPVFEELGVNIVFSGHDHVYARSKPLVYDGALYVSNNETQGAVAKEGGPVYVITGRSCDKTYSIVRSLSVIDLFVQGNDPNGANYYGKENYLAVQADDRSMNIKTYGIDGTLLDQFSLSKTQSAQSSPLQAAISFPTPASAAPASQSPTLSQTPVATNDNASAIVLILALAVMGTIAVAIYNSLHRKKKNRRRTRRS